MAYLSLESPEKSEWLRAAQICLTVAQSVGSKGSKLEHFMPNFDPPKKQTAADQLAVFGSISDIPDHIRERFQ